MAETNDRVMEMVEKVLADAPDTSTSELFERAKEVDSEMAGLSVRQFHARYPLQVKRRKSLAEGGGRRKSRKSRGKRGRSGKRGNAGSDGAVHAVLMEFAHAVSAANDEGATAMVEFLSGLDGWVERVEKARG